MLFIEKSTTAKAVKFLLSKDYIYNKQIDNDKRYSSLYLTEKGREAAVVVEAVFSEILDVFSENIPDSMMEQSILVMKKVISNLQAEKNRYITE